MLRKVVALLLISQLGGCAWLGAAANPFKSYSCFGGIKNEAELFSDVGPLVIIDAPFTLVADTLSLPFCGD